ncbi:MAG TPA: metallophosphoesterase family protein [Usitatibacter sp.]|nr:metallophosphoesterase family protein [Usitatibacter sp.]
MAIYGILGDVHGNREALVSALAYLDDQRVDQVLCVGDIVGYNADPDECVTMLREREAACIAGNHDLIGTGLLGFERCSNKAMHSLKRTRRTMTRETAAWLRSLPSHRVLEERFLLTHGGVRDVQQYMTRPKHFLENARYLRRDFPGIRLCFYGHTHEQRVFEIDAERTSELDAGADTRLDPHREYFLNPGSVDASRKRARKMAELAIFDSQEMRVHFAEVPYDERATEARAEAGGYRIDGWRDRLYDVQRRFIGPRHVETNAP